MLTARRPINRRSHLVDASVVLLLGALLTSHSAVAVTLGQTDDFEDLTTLGWFEGGDFASSPNPPQNIPNGGPNGQGDAHINNVSSGVSGPGGRMVQLNETQWTGDYIAAGIAFIEMDVKVETASSLTLRVGFQSVAQENANSRRGWVSANGITVVNDGAWHRISFPISATDLVSSQSLETYDATMSDVGQFRIHHAATAFFHPLAGDIISATLKTDNITAVGHAMPSTLQRVLTVSNLGGSSASELSAVLEGSLNGYVRDASTDALLGSQVFNGTRTPLDAEVVDINGSPAIAALGEAADGRAWVEVRDAVTGTLVRDVWFSTGFTPLALAVLPDINGNNTSEVAVLMTKPSDNDRAWVHIKDSQTLAYVNNVWFQAGYTPLDLEVVPNIDGNAGPELAVLMTRDADNDRAWVHLKDAMSGAYVKNVWFQSGYTPKDLAIIDNLDGNPGSEVAVLFQRDSDSRPWVHIKDALTGAYVKNVWFDMGYTPMRLEIIPDLDTNAGDELAVLTSKDSDGRAWVHIKDALSSAFIKSVWFQGDFAPKDFTIVPDMDANPGDEIAVLGERGSGQIQVEIKDAKTITWINLVNFP